MNRRHVALSFVISAFIIGAGCYGLVTDPPSDDVKTAGPTAETSESGQRVAAANPYEKQTLTVGIDETNTERDTEPLVRDALEYWEQNSAEYAGYPIEYELRPNATDPDVQITWVEEVNSCDLSYDTYLLGCADIPGERAPETASVVVETGLIRNHSVGLLQHELGHTLGLTHDDEPADVMAAKMNATPRETHVDVQIVWQSDDHDRDDVTEQVRHAFDYYESWTQTNTETNLTYGLNTSETRTPDQHDFYIEVSDDRDLCDGNVSCVNYDEGDIITDNPYTVRYADIQEDGVGWYTGIYLGSYLGHDADEIPATFQKTDSDHILGEWWED